MLYVVLWNPGSQALPLLLSFHQHHVPRAAQVYFGSISRPGASGLLGCMSCMSTSRFFRHYYTMDKIELAAKKRKSH